MTHAKRSAVGLCAVLLIAFILLASAPSLYAEDEAQSWYHALDLSGRAVRQVLAIQAIGMVLVLVLVGWVLSPIWRGAIGSAICIGFQVFQDPRLLTSPSVAIADRAAKMSTLGEQEALANVALAGMVVFVFLLIFDVYLALKPTDPHATVSYGSKSTPAKEAPKPATISAPPPPPNERKSIFD